MKKNRTMRVASSLMVLVLITSCIIGGTFAKYVTTANSEDSARVAYWGFQSTNAIDITDLFKDVYATDDTTTYTGTNSVDSEDGDDVIAPGTTNSDTFAFAYDETNAAAPEVAYTFTVDTTGSTCADSIKNNANIQWKLDNGSWGTWDQLIASIKALSGDASGSKVYGPNTLPTGFTTADDVHTVAWQWVFSTGDGADATDTAMGNAADLAEVELHVAITATQVD